MGTVNSLESKNNDAFYMPRDLVLGNIKGINPTIELANMAIPFVPLLKLIALGSIKLIFLCIGIVFFPVFALKFILGGATSMLLPTLDWLEENQKLDANRHDAIVNDLAELSSMPFTKAESRHLLGKLIKKMFANTMASAKMLFGRVGQAVKNISS